MLGLRTLAWKSFRYFSRSHWALALGITTATAVIVGALVVGDSVRGSLRGLVLSRLANIGSLMRTRHFVDQELFKKSNLEIGSAAKVVPLVLLSQSSVEFSGDGSTRRATGVQILAIDSDFYDALDAAGQSALSAAPGADEVLLNESLARELDVKPGDSITLLLSTSGGVPPDTPLGRRELTSKNLPRQKVARIVRDQSIGSIAFQSTQEIQKNVFASLKTVQEFLQQEDKFNAAVAFETTPSQHYSPSAMKLADELTDSLQPKLEDLGVQIARHRRIYPDESRGETSDSPPVTIFDYYQLTSQDLLIDRKTGSVLVESLGEKNCARLLSFLVNSIQKAEPKPRQQSTTNNSPSIPLTRAVGIAGAVRTKTPLLTGLGRIVPYSIVVGISAGSELDLHQLDLYGDALSGTGCLVSSWLADDLSLKEGDRLQVEMYEPETVDGRPAKCYSAFRVLGIANVKEPSSPFGRRRAAEFPEAPTPFNDPDLTPTVEGITDQSSIANWNVPFDLELKDKIQKQDDVYYDNHRLTPKIFLPYHSAQQLAGSRFGDLTAIRIPAAYVSAESELRKVVEPGLRKIARDAGIAFVPVRQQMLAAASGTTPFDMLFLSLSSFVIISALMLVALLFKLSIQQRTGQLGILFSQGFSLSKVRRLVVTEFLLVSLLGGLIGVPTGLGYAKLLILGLESWWVGAISSQFLSFSFGWSSILVGLLAGVLASLLTIVLSLRKISAAPTLALLRGTDVESQASQKRAGVAGWTASTASAIVALLLSLVAFSQTGMGRAGCFFGVGMLLLLSAWLATRQILLRKVKTTAIQASLMVLASQAVRRSPLRSSLSIGLLAVASFLIASLGVFRMSPTRQGYGGFDLIGVSSQPIYANMSSPAARRELIGAEADKLRGAVVMPMRMREGDDASCNNLYQTKSPTILGVTASLQNLTESLSEFEFSWAASVKPHAPWDALSQYAGGVKEQPIPVILDQNTAMWSLKQGASLNSIIQIDIDGSPYYFRVVGLLNNSVLQGKLLISEPNFQNLFPKISGYRFFMINSESAGGADDVTRILESGLSTAGLDVQSSQEILNRLLGVQNTYISAFQSLGALGLLLGSIGLVAVQLRSVWERRRELALMQAVGFSKIRIGNLLTIETAILLGAGLLIGVLAAAVSLIPFVLQVGPQLSLIQPFAMLAAIFVVGFVSASLAIRVALKLSLLSSLRSE